MPVRLRIHVDPAYVARLRARGGQRALVADVERRVQGLGYARPRVVMQDPTRPDQLTVLTDGQGRKNDDALRVGAVEPVAMPASPSGSSSPLDDPGLTPEEIETVRYALRTEHNPRHLRGFATTLESTFPVAASLLYARAAVLEPASTLSLYDASRSFRASDADIDKARDALDRYASTRRLPMDGLRAEVRRAAARQNVGGIPPSSREVARLARLTVRPIGRYRDGEELFVVDANAMRRAVPPDRREGFVSPAALQLAQALGKPELSGVFAPRKAKALADELDEPDKLPAEDRYDARRAKVMVDKAMQTLERERWLKWYARKRQVERGT